MAKEYDTSGKALIELGPVDWLRLAGIEAARAVVENVNTTTVQVDADAVVRFVEPVPLLAQTELQSSYKPDVVDRIARYKALLRSPEVAVTSTVILLRRRADGPAMTGVREQGMRGDGSYFCCDYRVIRVWQIPVEQILAGGPGTLPLAPLTRITVADLPRIVDAVSDRLEDEADTEMARQLTTAMFLLAGLRYNQVVAVSFAR